jgi:hypothetical protein
VRVWLAILVVIDIPNTSYNGQGALRMPRTSVFARVGGESER